MSAGAGLQIGKLKVNVSNLEKVLYPAAQFTKGQVIDYYVHISPFLLPHLKNRPITLKRYPDGVNGFFFYEKQCPSHRPDWVETTKVARKDGSEIDYCLINDLPALVWAANLADLELHTFLHRAPKITVPNAIAFDLDPGPPANIIECCQVGLWLKDLLAEHGLQSFPKTSGSKGLQLFVPLNTPTSYEKTKAFARAVAETLESEHPKLIVAKMKKELRGGKVFIDWSQNDEHKTTVSVYSLRAKDQPQVSTPVSWAEVASALKKKKALSFVADDVLKRVAETKDLFSPVLDLKQNLPSLRQVQ